MAEGLGGQQSCTALVVSTEGAEARWTDAAARRVAALKAWQERDLGTLCKMVEVYTLLRSGGKFSRSALNAYRTGCRDLVEWLWAHHADRKLNGDIGLHILGEIRRGTFKKYFTREMKDSYVVQMLTNFKNAEKALRWAGLWDIDLFAHCHAGHSTPLHSKREPYAPDEVCRLLEACSSDFDEIAIRLCLDAGLRATEATSLLWTEVNISAHSLVILHGKGDKRRVVYLGNGPLYKLLAKNMPAEGERQWPVVPKMLAVCDGVFGRAKMHRELHRLRHTCARDLLALGGSLEAVQAHLGHESILTTQVYAKMAAQDYHAAVDKRYAEDGEDTRDPEPTPDRGAPGGPDAVGDERAEPRDGVGNGSFAWAGVGTPSASRTEGSGHPTW